MTKHLTSSSQSQQASSKLLRLRNVSRWWRRGGGGRGPPPWVRLGLRALDESAVVVNGDVRVRGEAGIGGVERVVVGLDHGGEVGLVDAVLYAAGITAGGQ